MKQLQQVACGVLGLLLFIVMIESVAPRAFVMDNEELEPLEECVGKPIIVDFPYDGGVAEPWSCEPQCIDNNPRYLLYTNGTATQCEEPPGCNDYGEDFGVTCLPPSADKEVTE